MHRKSLAALAVVLTAGIVSPATAVAPSPIIRAVEPVANSYIVTLGTPHGDVRAVAPSIARTYGGSLGYVYTAALNGFSIRMSEARALAMAADPRIIRVEQDGVMRAIATQTGATWGLDRIDQRDRPLNGNYVYNATGNGVRAYIIDTGILTTHTDFGGRASHGYDFVSNDANATDCNGHGTHVAGTVGGATWGVAKAARLVGVRVLDCAGSGATSGVIAGVDWVTANKIKPAVANMSLGGGASSSLDNAVTNSINSGVTYALAAGNGDLIGNPQNACNTSPARTPSAITVSATDSSDRKASWANYGTCVDIFGPGVSIKSAWYTSTSATNTISGTSMASPHVAGAAALYLEGSPSATPATVGSALTDNASLNKVTSPGTGSPNKLVYTGFINGGTPPPNQAPAANYTYSCTGLTCSFTDTSTDSDGTIASRSWNFGDGSTSTATNPSRTYAAAGTYNVQLTVTDNGGLSNSTTKAVTTSSTSDPDPSTPNLTNGVASSGTNGGAGTWKYYKIQVPAGRSSLAVTLSGTSSCGLLSCNPDLDLFVRRAAKPTTATYNCKSENNAANESCSVSNPAADWWYVGVYTYSGSASINYTIKATY